MRDGGDSYVTYLYGITTFSYCMGACLNFKETLSMWRERKTPSMLHLCQKFTSNIGGLCIFRYMDYFKDKLYFQENKLDAAIWVL